MNLLRTRHAFAAVAVLAAGLTAGVAAPVPAADHTLADTSHAATAAAVPRVITPAALQEPSPADTARTELAQLTVAEPHSMAGYSRAKLPHWITQHGACDTREVVLQRDGQDVKQDDQCRAISGTWTSPYDSKEITSASMIDIDHVVPLAAGWRAGADEWTTDQRRAFANDLTRPQLIAVSASSNRQKGDQPPDQWRPQRSYWCTYSRAWIDVKDFYNLNVTGAEMDALAEMLDTCPTL
ncbi:HNH endonuclease family protein [Streptomyces polygonati]|uniref:HNH endonuclease family protein n=1 Tax=Streptomyces polygonati TaxID=1617087 RepID=A0ABV8HSY8_9ACTN